MFLLKTCFCLTFFLIKGIFFKVLLFHAPNPGFEKSLSFFPQMTGAAISSLSRALELNTHSFKNHQHRISCQVEKPILHSMI